MDSSTSPIETVCMAGHGIPSANFILAEAVIPSEHTGRIDILCQGMLDMTPFRARSYNTLRLLA